MQTQTLTLDQTFDSLHWSSERPPELHVNWILFHLPRRDDRDFEWIGRLTRATLKFECRLLHAGPPEEAPTTIGGVRIASLISPYTVQPLFDIGKHWHFEAPVHNAADGIGKPHWETRSWLEDFELRDGESATLMLTTNAHPVAELHTLLPALSAARTATLEAGLRKDKRSAMAGK